MADALLLTHAVATLFLLGLIWVVQLVHYPLMDRVQDDRFPAFERAHQRRIGVLVGPAMLVEAATGVGLAIHRPPGVAAWLVAAGLVLIAVHGVSTALLQMPCHRRLERGFDAATHRRLVRSNAIRTAAWSLRAALVAAMLAGRITAGPG